MFSSYIHNELRAGYHKKPGDKEDGCKFCGYIKTKDYITSTGLSFVIANIYPYNYGHLLISPIRHVKDLRELTKDELKDLLKMSLDFLNLLEKVYDVHSFNVGFNLGPSSGATVEHLHIHVVPRWAGDSGFMETTSSTRAIKETPQQTTERLKNALTGKVDINK